MNKNPRFEEYNQSLEEHVLAVTRSWEEFLKPKMTDWLITETDATVEEITLFFNLVAISMMKHDESKYDDKEYFAYLNYFYPSEGFEQSEEELDRAWLHHQKRNHHHFQYWILIRDSGEVIPLDMPLSDICEMICDWHSFSFKNPSSTAFNYWAENKDKMLLSDNTKNIVESLIIFLKDPLM